MTRRSSRSSETAAHDGTARIERSLQEALRKLRNAGEISDEVYQDIRPTGSVRPRLYGVAKVHKDGTPLRPILSMYGSPQHVTAQWLARVLKLVQMRYSKHTVKDSFTFVEMIRQTTVPPSAHMCSFDIKSLFTNVPLEETIDICVNQLYNSDLQKPALTEKSFRKLIQKVTAGVEFSFNDIMYQQVDGVAMGSPLGPVLANIFVGYHEERLSIDNRKSLLLYCRYVDDTFPSTSHKTRVRSFWVN